jgi:hypothetical protein
MPKIKVLRNLGQGLPDYREGQTVQVSNEVADQLCGLSLATLAESTPKGKSGGGTARGKQVHGVPDKSAIAEKNESKIKSEQNGSVLI